MHAWTLLAMWGAGCWTSTSEPLPVEVRGCIHVEPGPVCLRPKSRALILWVPTPEPPTVALDGRPQQPEIVAVSDGHRLTLPAPEGHTLVVTAPQGSVAIELREWTLAPGIREARERLGEDAAGAISTLRDALERVGGEHRIQVLWALSAVGDPSVSSADVERAAIEQSSWHWAMRAANHQAYEHLSRTRDTKAARNALARSKEYADRLELVDYRRAWSLDYYLGRAHQTGGNHRHALIAMRAAEGRALRFEHTRDVATARSFLSESLVRAGQVEEAMSALRASLEMVEHSEAATSCELADALNAYAWGALQAREAGLSTDVDPAPLLDRALATLDEGDCSAQHDRAQYLAHTHLNRALVAVQRDQPSIAVEHLAAGRRADPELDEPWALEIEGRYHLAVGDAQRALRAFEALESRSPEQLELQWMALRGQGRALQALGQDEQAIDRLDEAQQLFFRQSLLVPVHLGRASFLSQRSVATGELVHLLLRQGRPADAVAAFRQFRSQYFLGLNHTDRLQSSQSSPPEGWLEALGTFREIQTELSQLPASADLPRDEALANEQLRATLKRRANQALDQGNASLGVRMVADPPPPEPGELLLGWIETPIGWVGLAQMGEKVSTHHYSTLTPATLLEPFADQILAARVVSLLPWGKPNTFDLHSLPLGGAPAVEHTVLRYAMDLRRRSGDIPRPASALVVYDPDGDLPESGPEGRSVAKRLGAVGADVRSLARGQADRATVLTVLPTMDWFHFSGHGEAKPGWGAQLSLSNGSLDIGDILALDSAPSVVVLNACEGGRQATGAVGLAQAFATAGAHAVVAPIRPVEDRLATRFADSLYTALQADPNPEAAYRSAVTTLRQEAPTADWSTFRLIVP